MPHLQPSLRSNQEPQTVVVPLVLTLHRPVSRLLWKASPNLETIGTTTHENVPITTTIIGDPTLRPPLAICLRDRKGSNQVYSTIPIIIIFSLHFLSLTRPNPFLVLFIYFMFPHGNFPTPLIPINSCVHCLPPSYFLCIIFF